MVLPTTRGWEKEGRRERKKEGKKMGNKQEEEGRMMKERWKKREKGERKKCGIKMQEKRKLTEENGREGTKKCRKRHRGSGNEEAWMIWLGNKGDINGEKGEEEERRNISGRGRKGDT